MHMKRVDDAVFEQLVQDHPAAVVSADDHHKYLTHGDTTYIARLRRVRDEAGSAAVAELILWGVFALYALVLALVVYLQPRMEREKWRARVEWLNNRGDHQ